MRAVRYDGAGGNEVVRIDDVPVPEPRPDEVRLQVRYAGMNPADVGQREGRYPAPPGSPPDIGGIETCGVVESCGEAVTRWQPGDRVYGLVGGGGFAQYVVASQHVLAAVPDRLSDEEAAAAPEALITAHDALTSNGGFRPGDRVLVNGANGGVGSAAVQIALAWQSDVVGTSRSPGGLEYIESLGASAVEHQAYLDEVDEDGFDLIVELVGGQNLAQNLRNLRSHGRLVLVGMPLGDDVHVPLRLLTRKRGRVVGTQLRNRSLPEKALAVERFAHEVTPLLEAGSVTAHVDRIFPAEQAAAAFDHLNSSGKRGKVLLDFSA